MRFPLRIALVFAAPLICLAQSSPEVTATAATPVFQSSTNLVEVPVVVRDGQGHATGTLRVEDFRLFDNGKPQTISKFSVEKFEGMAAAKSAAPDRAQPASASDIAIAALPSRFVAYLFDDLHMTLQDLTLTRKAATRQIDSLNLQTQRVAIFTTSGRHTQEFTNDLDLLHAALASIVAGQADAEKAMGQVGCPKVDYYMGDLIYNKHDPATRLIALADAVKCGFRPDTAERAVDTAARAAVLNGDLSTGGSLDNLLAIVNRMAALPGQRAIVLVSPGFLVLDDKLPEETGVIDRALKASVIIGALDARGLYTTSPDASGLGMPDPAKTRLKTTEGRVLTDAIANMAEGTGGSFYHGTNDYDEAFARVAAAPEYIYMLAFSPTDLKANGKAHQLRVTLKNPHGFTVQARGSYFPGSLLESPADRIRQQIQDAFFSNQEVKTLPVRLQAEFFKDGDNATLTANVRVDAAKLRFAKEDGRNNDDLTMVIGIFDQNGNFISAFQKTIQLRLKDETLSAWMKSGIENSTDFNLKPGKYLVRLVVRDSKGESMAEESTGVDIPW